MKAQVDMDFEQERAKLQRATGSSAWNVVLEALKAAVRTMTPKEVAFLLPAIAAALEDAT